MLRPVSIMIVTALLAGVTGCSTDFKPGEARHVSNIKITQRAKERGTNGFTPNPVSVVPRTEVVWTNTDSEPHQIESAGGYFSATNPIQPGQSFSFTFTNPGPYRYFCALSGHREEGVINVTR